MKRITINDDSTQYVEYTGDIVAMYSPQLFRVVYAENTKIQVTVLNRDTLDYATDVRYPVENGNRYVTEFDISRLLQIVGDLDNVLNRIDYSEGVGAISERIRIEVRDAQSEEISDPVDVTAIYAACDVGEQIAAYPAVHRRWFIGFPQTFSYGLLPSGAATFRSDEYPEPMDISSGTKLAGYEYPPLMASNRMRKMWLSYATYIVEGQHNTPYSTEREYDLTVDNCTKGVYLRWLQRDGSVGYWLFTKSRKTFASAQAQSFTAHLSGVPAAVDGGSTYRNAQKGDFSVSESLTIGSGAVTAEEYDYLCGLTCSPVVDMFIGGSIEEPLWQRVNIAAGSYTRDYPRSGLRRTAEFECVILLPKKNTITY